MLGRVAGEYAAQRAVEAQSVNQSAVDAQAKDVVARLKLFTNKKVMNLGLKSVMKWVP